MRQETTREKHAKIIMKLCSLGLRLIPLHNPTQMGCSCGKKNCSSPGKHPINSDWQRGYFSQASGAVQGLLPPQNVGVLTGDGLFVLDVDDKHEGGLSLQALEKDYGPLPSTLTVKTGAGYHYYYKADGEVPLSVNKVGIGIDIRGDGGFVVAPPSTHANGKQYQFSGPCNQINNAPGWLVDLAIGEKKKKNRSGNKIVEGGRNNHLTSIAGTMRRKGLGERAIREALMVENEENCNPPLGEEEVRNIAYSISMYPSEENTVWHQLLAMTKAGAVIRSEGNALIVMSHSDVFKGCLEYDSFTGRGRWVKQPNTVHQLHTLGPEYNPDTDYMEVQSIIAKEYGITFTKSSIQDGLYGCMKTNAHDSLKKHINELKWDGKARLDGWLHKYCGADNSRYTKVIGTKFIISAIARALHPGCKVDYMLIMESVKQGIGKSTITSILGGKFYDDGPIDVKSRDFMLKLRGAWFYEVSELSGLRRGQVEALKAFISDCSDSYREPYGRYNTIVPRRAVFVGTTNETNYLQDAENRRFWPIKVDNIKTDKFREDRDNILAEARERFLADESYWPTPEEQETLMSPAQKLRLDTLADPWLDAIRPMLMTRRSMGKNFIPMSDLWACIGIDVEKRTGWVSNRLTRCMDILGWGKHRTGNDRGFKFDKEVRLRDELLEEVPQESSAEISEGNIPKE